MQGLCLVLALAVTVEALVEYAKAIAKAVRDGEKKTAVTYLAAIGASALLCFSANANLYELLGVHFTWPWLGIVLTGVFASRGANFVSDLYSKLKGSQEAKENAS